MNIVYKAFVPTCSPQARSLIRNAFNRFYYTLKFYCRPVGWESKHPRFESDDFSSSVVSPVRVLGGRVITAATAVPVPEAGAARPVVVASAPGARTRTGTAAGAAPAARPATGGATTAARAALHSLRRRYLLDLGKKII